MTTISLNKVTDLINHQSFLQENATEYLVKALAVSQVSHSEDFLEFPKMIIEDYLWELTALIEHAHQASEEAMKHLLAGHAMLSEQDCKIEEGIDI
jgi:hypothetical protein